MNDGIDSLSEEEPSVFRPFTRESLQVIQGRIAIEEAKLKELERKRAEGEVISYISHSIIFLFAHADYRCTSYIHNILNVTASCHSIRFWITIRKYYALFLYPILSTYLNDRVEQRMA